MLKGDRWKKSPLEAFAKRWGYEEVSYDWEETVSRADIDIADIGTPTFEHMEMAVLLPKPANISYAKNPVR